MKKIFSSAFRFSLFAFVLFGAFVSTSFATISSCSNTNPYGTVQCLPGEYWFNGACRTAQNCSGLKEADYSICGCKCTAASQAATSPTCGSTQVRQFNNSSCTYSCVNTNPTFLTKYSGGTGGAEDASVVFQNGIGQIGVGTTNPSDGTSGGGQVLKLDVEGAIGAAHYCDENGENCVAGNNIGSGGAGLWTASGNDIHRNISGGKVAIGTNDFTGWGNDNFRVMNSGHTFAVGEGTGKLIGDAGSNNFPYFSVARGGDFGAYFGYGDADARKVDLSHGPNDLLLKGPGNVGITQTFNNVNPGIALDVVDGSMGARQNIYANTLCDYRSNGNGDGIDVGGSSNCKSVASIISGGATQLWTQSGPNVYRNSSVAIGSGTINGSLRLDVNGNVGANNYCDGNGSNCSTPAQIKILTTNLGSCADGQILEYDSSTSRFVCVANSGGGGGGSSLWSSNGSNVFYSTALNGTERVGIGTNAPTEKLQVNGAVRAQTFKWAQSEFGTDQGGSLELGGSGSPYIDFSNDTSSDYDGRIILMNDNNLSIYGADLFVQSNDVTADAFLYSSDRRLKKNIKPIENALEKVKALAGVFFDWKKDDETNLGFIAQDVEEVLPELVNTNENGMKSVRYGNITAVLVEAMKEQQSQIEELKAEIEELKK